MCSLGPVWACGEMGLGRGPNPKPNPRHMGGTGGWGVEQSGRAGWEVGGKHPSPNLDTWGRAGWAAPNLDVWVEEGAAWLDLDPWGSDLDPYPPLL